ncbi:MAG TPA: hypothetical protein VGK67_29590 [Myxococcales bacterium]|jgi:hypothetical protein
MGFDIGSLFNPMSMLQGITGGGEKTHQAEGAKPKSGIDQIGDSFKNGDIMGGIGQILGMVTGMGGGGGGMNVTEMMNPSMFMDPLSKMVFEEISKQGYSQGASSPDRQQSAVGSPTYGTPASGQPVSAKPPTYDEKWASAVNELNDHFDLLDTAAGIDGKDGLIARCDLEAALKNPGLPPELRQACQFLLANPAAFNQMEVSAGIGKCDGLIGKCDVGAALKALPKKAEPAKTEDAKKTSTPDQYKADGTGGTNKTGSKDDAKAGETEKTGGGSGTKGSQEISNPYVGLNVEEILWEVMNGINGDLNDVANKLKTTAKDSEDFAKLEQQLQKLMDRRKEMYALISNMNAAEHSMAMTAIGNIR